MAGSALAAGEALGREVGDGVLANHTHAQLRIGEIHVRMLADADRRGRE